MFDYNPKDADAKVFPAGDYTATIEKVADDTSKSSGNPMLVVTLRAWGSEKGQIVTDYIVNPTSLFKLKKLAVALGALESFNAGKFDPADYVEQNVTVTLAVEEGRDGFDSKNVIKAYKPKGEHVPASAPTRGAVATLPPDDDDVPF